MLTITIDTSNDAFADNPAPEVARILRDLAGDMDGRELTSGDGANLRDINGNLVGQWKVTR